jgi:hypothetical protein
MDRKRLILSILLGLFILGMSSIAGCSPSGSDTIVVPPADTEGEELAVEHTPDLGRVMSDGLCPPLASPTGSTVTVSEEAELRDQAHNAAPGTTILISAGTYNLENPVHVINANITLRGATGNRDDVILDAGGMGAGLTHGILVEADDVTIADLTIRNSGEHGVSINGSDRPILYNLHILDTGSQLVKVNPLDEGGSEDGLLACSRLEYTTTAPTEYTNGISAHHTYRWVVRDNEWYRIRTPGNTPVPTILFWSGSSDTIVERNLLVDCYQGISFGNASHGEGDHSGGIVRNNFIYASMPHDVVIEMVHATGWLVAHNTALLLNPNGVTWGMEARFSGTEGTFANNLTNMEIWLDRDGANAVSTGNITNAQTDWFVDVNSADLHLLASATQAIDQAELLSQVGNDVDGESRPAGSAADVGADECSLSSAGQPTKDLTAQSQATQPQTPYTIPEGLLQPSDLIYQGAFRYPEGDEWTWGGHALAFYPQGDPNGPADGYPGSLYAAGQKDQDLVGEMSIPVPVIADTLEELPAASVLQPLSDITGGWKDKCTYFEGCEYRDVDGLEYLANIDKVVWNLRDWYNVGDVDQDSLGWSNLDMTGAQGVWHIGDRPSEKDVFHTAKTSNYLFLAPESFANQYLGGKWLIAGNSREAGARVGSQGPTLYALAPWEDGAPPQSGQNLDALALLYYPDVYPGCMDDPDQCYFPNYRVTDDWGGGAWVQTADKEGILIFGRKALGDNCYGTPEECGGDPCNMYKGYHAYPQEPQILFYDPQELVEVVAGTREPWEIVPYIVYKPVNEVINQECTVLGAVAYDQEMGLIYVAEHTGEPYGVTVVHVWKVE